MKRFFVMALAVCLLAGAASAEERKPKSKVTPMYPELAKRMNVNGVVRLEVTVKPTGEVKSSRALGGHPLLITAAQDAVSKWKYEPSSSETVEVVEFHFSGATN